MALYHKPHKRNYMNIEDNREEYIKYFTRMQEEDKKAHLSGVAWNWIIAEIYNATEQDKLFTKNELADMFPSLLGYIKED